MVKELPLTVPGPESTLKVTGLPEAPPVALRAMGPAPYATGDAGGVKEMA